MKKRSYLGPILVFVIGVIASFILLFLTFSELDFMGGEFVEIDESNNMITLQNSQIASLYIGKTDAPYIVEEIEDGLMIYFFQDGDFLAIYHVMFQPVFGSIPLTVKTSSVTFNNYSGKAEIATISADSGGYLNVTIEPVLENDEFPLELSVYENDFNFTGFRYMGFLVGTGFLTVLVTAGYSFLIYRSRNKKVKSLDGNSNEINVKKVIIDPLQELIETDKSFSLESQNDKVNAWLKYTLKYTTMGSSSDLPFVNGREEIEKTISELYQLKNLNFKWKPTIAYVSTDATLGVTVGLYKRSYIRNNEIIEDKGKYISVWRNIDGLWKIVFDMGN